MEKKMKIGILTQPLHFNYGGLLQNYALQQVLRKYGYDAETIDWDVPDSVREKLYRIKMSFLNRLFPSKYQRPAYRLSQNEKKIIWQHTRHFVDEYIVRSKTAKSEKEIRSIAKKNGYSAFIVGSDQCWRPLYNVFLNSMYLNFVDNQEYKEIAYAASFGTDKWEYTDSQTRICSNLAKKFNLITVREDTGVILCEKYLGVKAFHVLDPTLLLDKKYYIELIEKEQEKESEGSLFYYVLDPTKRKMDFINRVSTNLGLQSFKEDIRDNIDNCIYPSVTEWLRAFMDAEMTIVDSFHGMVFSIIFNKPFWVISNSKRGTSRFTSLLKQLGLEDRLIDEESFEKVDYKKEINWLEVNAKIGVLKTHSIQLLLEGLGGGFE